jgi:deoxyribose-phosphate aldolase
MKGEVNMSPSGGLSDRHKRGVREKVMNIAKFIDHTFLKSAGRRDEIEKLCREARRCAFASVCVNPAEVRFCARTLHDSAVKVCTVIDFPLGASTSRSRCFEALDAIQSGADELDLVVNQRLLKYSPAACEAELLQWVRTCRTLRSDLVLKLILECCNLTRKEIVLGCRIAKRVGFDFVKTSTGFGTGGATLEDVKLMRKTVGADMGVKAAGGIRDRETALAMIEAGADRIGTSAGVKLM